VFFENNHVDLKKNILILRKHLKTQWFRTQKRWGIYTRQEQ